LRQDPLAGDTSEPEEPPRNEPERPPAAANDDALTPGATLDSTSEAASRNEPGRDPWDTLPAPVRAELDRLLAADDLAGLARLGATGALHPLGLQPEDLASPQALGRALFRPAVRDDGAAGLAAA
jgi:hypothetical protein